MVFWLMLGLLVALGKLEQSPQPSASTELSGENHGTDVRPVGKMRKASAALLVLLFISISATLYILRTMPI